VNWFSDDDDDDYDGNDDDTKRRENVNTFSVYLESNIFSTARDEEYNTLLNNVHKSPFPPDSFQCFCAATLSVPFTQSTKEEQTVPSEFCEQVEWKQPLS
jgi:hypothetical protein